jgi:hypothetical protein
MRLWYILVLRAQHSKQKCLGVFEIAEGKSLDLNLKDTSAWILVPIGTLVPFNRHLSIDSLSSCKPIVASSVQFSKHHPALVFSNLSRIINRP